MKLSEAATDIFKQSYLTMWTNAARTKTAFCTDGADRINFGLVFEVVFANQNQPIIKSTVSNNEKLLFD